MTSTFTPNKHLEEPANGDYVNTWSTPVNANFSAIDTAFGGSTILNAVSASGVVALTTTQYLPPLIFVTGALTANVNYQLPSGVGGRWSVANQTSGAFTITVSSAGGGSAIIIPQGFTVAVICDGTNVGRADTSPNSAAGSAGQLQYNLLGALAGAPLYYNGTNFGFGTSTPSELVTTQGNLLFSAPNPYIQFNAGSARISSTSANTLSFLTDPSNERMRIASNGFVGIGTSTPSTMLQVTGTVSAGSFFSYSDGTNPAADFLNPFNGTTGALRLRGNASSLVAIIQITDSTASAQWGYCRFDSGGGFSWSGTFASGGQIVSGGKIYSQGSNLVSYRVDGRASAGITFSTSPPGGGSDGDMWFQYS